MITTDEALRSAACSDAALSWRFGQWALAVLPATVCLLVLQIGLVFSADRASAEEPALDAGALSSRASAEHSVLPFAGAWAPEENSDPCGPIRENAAEGDFFVVENRQLMTGAELGCQIEEVVEQPQGTFYLRLHCAGSNVHFTGTQYAKLIVDSPDRLSFRFKGNDTFVPHVRCGQ